MFDFGLHRSPRRVLSSFTNIYHITCQVRLFVQYLNLRLFLNIRQQNTAHCASLLQIIKNSNWLNFMLVFTGILGNYFLISLTLILAAAGLCSVACMNVLAVCSAIYRSSLVDRSQCRYTYFWYWTCFAVQSIVPRNLSARFVLMYLQQYRHIVHLSCVLCNCRYELYHLYGIILVS